MVPKVYSAVTFFIEIYFGVNGHDLKKEQFFLWKSAMPVYIDYTIF